MGLFDFIKPKKKKPGAELLQNPAMRSAMAGMEMEYLQKQVANLRSVGRKDDANKAVGDFLAKYHKEALGKQLSRLDLGRISYSIANATLPDLVFSRWKEFCDLWSGGVPFPMYLAIKGASDMGKRLSLEQIQEYKYYQGNLTSHLQYFLIEYPLPPEQGQGPNMEDLLAALAKGQGPSLDVVPVLGPYFSAVILNSNKEEKHVYNLGQSPGEGTTLRFVSAGGTNVNCGSGPEPSAGAFLESLRLHLKKI